MKSKGFSRVFLKFVCTYSLVLIIPIVVFSLFFYSNTKEQFLNNVKEERLHALALLNENISQQNSSIRRMASELVKTSALSEFNIVHGNTAHVDINSEVRKITGSNSYQTTTFYYLKATQTLYSQSGNYKLWQFNTPHFQYYYPGWNHEEMEAFLEHNSELMIRPAETLIIPSNNTRKMITFLFPLTKGTYTYGTMISLVDVERVEMILSSTYRSPEENLLAYSSAGDFLTSRYEIDNNTETWASKILEKDDGAYSGVIRREGKNYLLSYSARGRMEWRFISFIPVEFTDVGNGIYFYRS